MFFCGVVFAKCLIRGHVPCYPMLGTSSGPFEAVKSHGDRVSNDLNHFGDLWRKCVFSY